MWSDATRRQARRVNHQHLFSGDKLKSGSGDIAQQKTILTLDAIGGDNPSAFSLSILAEDGRSAIIGTWFLSRAATTTNIPDTDSDLTARRPSMANSGVGGFIS